MTPQQPLTKTVSVTVPSSLLKGRATYKPFLYPECFDFWLKQQQAHWLATEVPMSADVTDWKTKLSDHEKAVIGGTLKGFIQSEIHVSEYWSGKVAKWFPHPEISMMAVTFGAFESLHTHAYAHLNESLAIDDYDSFLAEPTAKAKIDRLVDANLGANFTESSENKKLIAKSLAIFSGFTEGVSLFSNFAVLLNFSRYNKLKGIGQIISWSIRDECYGEGTEILTPSGWVDLSKISTSDIVAQYNMEDGQINFVNPSRVVEQDYNGEMIRFSGEKLAFNALTTPNHDMISKWEHQKSWSKQKSKDLNINTKRKIPVSGGSIGEKTSVTSIEQFRIMTQADGHISKRYTGVRSKTIPVKFSFAKERKIERFRKIVKDCGFSFTETQRVAVKNKKDQKLFSVNVPVSLGIDKTFDWIDLSKISTSWVEEFVFEIAQWDGHTPNSKNSGNYTYYSCVDEKNVDKVQAVCSLGNYWATKSIQVDDRSNAFSDVHRLFIHKMNEKRLGSTKKTTEQYEGKVRCVTVPSGAIVVRYQDSVFIAGNCVHSSAGCWLFRKFIQENQEIWDDELKKEIYQAARDTVSLEDDFIDKVFEGGILEGLDPKDLKVFIRSRANQKLGELGMKMNWKNLDQEALKRMEWFDFLAAGVEHTDFFNQRVSSYSKGVVTFDDDIFGDED